MHEISEANAPKSICFWNRIRQVSTHQPITPTFAQGLTQLGLTLSDEQVRQFQIFEQELESWNQRINLTRITGHENTQVLHYLDSLSTLGAIPPEIRSVGRFIDIGAGAGFPGLPLKIVFPEIRLTLTDSVGKKVAFLQYLVQMLEFPDVNLHHGRAESLAHDVELRESFDVVLARGVARLPVLSELTLPFCKLGGVVVAHKKGDIANELKNAQKAIKTLGGRFDAMHPVDLPGLKDNRSLVVLEKIAPTPTRYPRRPGLPKKHPL